MKMACLLDHEYSENLSSPDRSSNIEIHSILTSQFNSQAGQLNRAENRVHLAVCRFDQAMASMDRGATCLKSSRPPAQRPIWDKSAHNRMGGPVGTVATLDRLAPVGVIDRIFCNPRPFPMPTLEKRFALEQISLYPRVVTFLQLYGSTK